jgi:hypothetical protein
MAPASQDLQPPSKGASLAAPNYEYQKRQRDLAKKQKKEEKKRRKAEAAAPPAEPDAAPAAPLNPEPKAP